MPDGVLPELVPPPPELQFFDAVFYRSANPDLAGLSEQQLEAHFLERAGVEGRPFLPVFDINFYRAANPDLAGLSNRELVTHFINLGLDQGRRFSPVLNLDFYRDNLAQRDPDIIEQLTPEGGAVVVESELFSGSLLSQPSSSLNRNLFNLFLESELDIETDLEIDNPEQFEGVDYSPFFDPLFYLNNNPDLAQAFGPNNRERALEHFATQGINENRRYSLIFDPNFYLENNPDLRAAGLNREQALIHFELQGLAEGRRPSLNFNPQFYLANNSDLQARGLSNAELIEQYLFEGLEEGRRSSLYFDPVAIGALLIPDTTPEEPQEGADEQEDTSPAQRLIEQNFVQWNTPIGGALTYSFVDTASAFLYDGPESGVGEVNEAIKNNVRQIMQEYDQILPFSLVEVPDRPPNTGQIRILFANNPTYAYSNAPGIGTGGDIVLSRNFENNPQLSFSQGQGNFGYQRLVHEIGHALGLRQPTNYTGFNLADRLTFPEGGPALPFSEDNNSNTAMSFNVAGVGASTPMPYDVRALQFLYGFSQDNSGNNLYKFDGTNFVGIKQTIWDAGGADTLDFSELPPIDSYFFDMNEGGQSTNKSVLDAATYIAINDPTPFPYSASSYGTYIAFGVTLENLIGTPVNDDILGNPAANLINGGAGADTIVGAEGPDTLTGGPGTDIFGFAPGDGTDVISDFTPGEDLIGLASPLNFTGISIESAGADTVLRVAGTGEVLAILTGVSADRLNANNFIPLG